MNINYFKLKNKMSASNLPRKFSGKHDVEEIFCTHLSFNIFFILLEGVAWLVASPTYASPPLGKINLFEIQQFLH